MNVMNVMNLWKSATFMPQPYENKGSLNVMNVVRKYFAARARVLPIGRGGRRVWFTRDTKMNLMNLMNLQKPTSSYPKLMKVHGK
jgi:hypothetical protein